MNEKWNGPNARHAHHGHDWTAPEYGLHISIPLYSTVGVVRSRTMAHSVQLVIAFAHHRRHRTDEYYCRNCKIEHQEKPMCGRTKRGDSKILWLNYEFIDKWLSGILNRDLIHWAFVRFFPAVWFFAALNISGASESTHERDYGHSGYGVGSHVWLNRCCSNGTRQTPHAAHTMRTMEMVFLINIRSTCMQIVAASSSCIFWMNE